MSILLGPAHQLGFVVRDMDATMRHWTENMGIGPFLYIDDVPVIECIYKGNPTPLTARLGFAYSGPMQIELIQPTNDASTAYRDFLDSGREGLHHLGFLSENYDADLEQALNKGLEVEMSGVAMDPQTRFVYFASTGHAGTMMELINLSDTLRPIFKMAREASSNWDGSDPLRKLG